MNQQDKIQIEQLMRDKHFEKALAVLATAIEAQAEDIDALYYSAVCLRYLNRLDEALLQLKALRKIAPSFGRGLQEEGHIYRAKGNLKQALHLYTRATHANPSLQGSWRRQIEILLKQGREAEAIRLKPHLAASSGNAPAANCRHGLYRPGQTLQCRRPVSRFFKAAAPSCGSHETAR